MKKPRFLISLPTEDNDYQHQQALEAQQVSRRLNVDIEILYARNDAIQQAQQLLEAIQSKLVRPDALLVEPAGGTALPVVAKAAGEAGIGWVLLNREAGYIAELAKSSAALMFSITADHVDIGRIQGRQLAAMLPKGGTVLYVQGPAESGAAKQRTQGLLETKPENIELRMLRGQWTAESAQRSVRAWLSLSTSRNTQIDAIACQDDSMAMGARKGFEEITSHKEKERWLKLPFMGCDGLPATGKKWVDQGLLAATVVIPANTGLALEMLVKARHGEPPPERTFTRINSYPSLESLAKVTEELHTHLLYKVPFGS